MYKKYNVGGDVNTGILVRKLPVNAEDFFSWKNVWRGTQFLIIIEALYYSAGMPIQALVVASFVTLVAWKINLV